MSAARMKHFGWGREGEGLSAEEEAFVMARAEARFGTKLQASASAPALDEIKLHAPRVTAPASLPFCTNDHYDRAAHTYGKAYPTSRAGWPATTPNAPDVVAYPRNESEVAAVLDWAGGADATVTPFGGGSSVCGGVERAAQRPQGRRHDRPARDGQGAGDRQDLARRADRGRHLWPRARSAVQAAWPDAPPFPAELRIFDARRLDRDARRRAFRDALHPHRRFRGVAAHGDAARHASRRAACRAPARARAPIA